MEIKSKITKYYLFVLVGFVLILLVSSMVIQIPSQKLNTKEYPEPPVLQLSQEMANELIEKEWIDQLGSKPIGNAAGDELLRVERILKRQSGKISDEVLIIKKGKLDKLKSKFEDKATDTKGLYFEIRKLKREILLGDPGIDFTGIVCIDNPYVNGSEQIHEIRSRTENTATPGGRLLLIEGAGPDAGVRKLAPNGQPAAFWRPDVSFDGKKVLFCMKEAQKPSYNIYETSLDGKEYRQVTNSEYNDLDPVYSPDGGIIFSTSRCNQYLRCGGSAFRMFILARSDKNGNNIYFISTNNEADYTPAFLPDGRILYTRWEYIDKSVLRIQSLWTVNPDGTNANTYYGNQSHWPDMLMNARPVPNSKKIIFNASCHHDIYAGPLGVIIQEEGMNYPDGLYNLTPPIEWAEVGKGPEDRLYNNEFIAPSCYMAFQTPFPINEDLILVSARKGINPNTNQDSGLPWFDLFLMDYDGNMELVYKGSYNILYAQPVRPRPVPSVIPSSVKWPGKMITADQKADWGVLYSADVYEGSGIPRGMVKALRILEVEAQTYGDGIRSTDSEMNLYRKKGAIPKNQGYHISGETAVSLVMDDATKRIWGTVPVEEDGSVNFKVPPVTGIYFQLLDEKGRALQTMRSITHVMPGETRGCLGCHQTKAITPPPKPSFATRRAPSEITPPVWGDETVNFPRFVQPTLDKYCISCHGSSEPKAGLNLTYRTEPGTLISWPYVSLVYGNNPSTFKEWTEKSIAGMIAPYYVYPNKDEKYPTTETVVPPMTALSYKSKLVDFATSGKHNGVKVTPEEEMRLVAWVDALCPYLGLEEIISQPDIDAESYFKQTPYKGLSYQALMHTAPYIHKAFMQDDFRTQADRIPKDSNGSPVPSLDVKDGKRTYRIPGSTQK